MPKRKNVLQMDQAIDEILELTTEEGLLETRPRTSQYQWVHDKVQEAVFSLVSIQKLRRLKSRVGSILIEQLETGDADVAIFVIVNLLNEGLDLRSEGSSFMEVVDRVRLAELNLQATRKAVALSAFKSASKYAKQGIQLLPENSWSEHYDMALELISYAAESEGSLGNREAMEYYCNKVLNRSEVPLSDKLRVYEVLIENMTHTYRHKEAVDLLLTILKQLGCSFPSTSLSRNLAIVFGLIRVKLSLRSWTPGDISSMPIMKDTMQIHTQKLLDRLSTSAYLCGCNDFMPLAIFKKINSTLKHGMCESSPIAFADYGILLTGLLGDLQGGSKMVEYGLLLLEKLKARREVGSGTILVSDGIVLPWTRPAPLSFKPLLEGNCFLF
jgi:predicted ATPase